MRAGTIALVPGLSTENDAHARRDARRGDADFRRARAVGRDDGLFLLPGTHSKWAEVADGRIVSFRTFMTGEVFGALKDHTILGRLMREGADARWLRARRARGCGARQRRSAAQPLFATRTYGLMDKLADTALSDYLSGLLIGAEVAEATRQTKSAVTIIASPALAQRYTDALRLLGHDSTLAPDGLRRGRPLAHRARRRIDARESAMDLRAALSQCPIVAILRGVKPDEIDAIGDALVEAGVTVIEVPLNSPQPFESIRRLAARHGAHALIGAGTVLEAADVARVKEAGGQLIVAPNFDADVVRAAKAAGLAALPGVMTPSEGFAALKAGADGLKLFPAEIIPPAVFKAWRAVFPADTPAARGRRRRRRQYQDLRGSRRVGLRHRLGALQAGPPGGGDRQAGARAGRCRKGLIFRPFCPIFRLEI